MCENVNDTIQLTFNSDLFRFERQEPKLKDMPIKRAFHCALVIEDVMFIHGGIEHHEDPISSTESVLYDFNNDSWSSIDAKFPCPPQPGGIKAQCSLWENNTIIVPSHNHNGEPCTAILDWKQKTWSTLKYDSRELNVQHGHLASTFSDNDELRLFFIGGNDIHTLEFVNGIYEFTGLDEGWKKFPRKLRIDIGVNMTFVTIPNTNPFCWNFFLIKQALLALTTRDLFY